MDALITMFNELRATRPPIYDGDKWPIWEDQISQVIANMPTRDQRWASVMLLADDLSQSLPGMPKVVAFLRIQDAVLRAGCR